MEWGPTYEATLALKGFSLPAEVVARWTAEAFDGVEHVEHSRSRDHYVAWERERLREMVRECGVGDDDAVQLVDDLVVEARARGAAHPAKLSGLPQRDALPDPERGAVVRGDQAVDERADVAVGVERTGHAPDRVAGPHDVDDGGAR